MARHPVGHQRFQRPLTITTQSPRSSFFLKVLQSGGFKLFWQSRFVPNAIQAAHPADDMRESCTRNRL